MKKALLLVAALGVAFAQQAKPEDVIKEQCARAKVVAEFWHGFTGGAPKAALENLVVEFNKAQQGRCVRPVPQGVSGPFHQDQGGLRRREGARHGPGL